ncbi:MAG: response regulator transcription factor [Sutterellaceae bacterium]|nr:response regulator transcription factor [Sutterellaceae bacterium]
MTDAATRILIIEDDTEISELLQEGLTARGFETFALDSGKHLFDGTLDFVPDVILLDVMLPGDDGLTICRKMRQAGSGFETTPLIIVSALGELTDRVVGLEIGADDYLVKPFEMHELVARIRALLRRTQRTTAAVTQTVAHAAEPQRRIWQFAHWRIDMDARNLIDEAGVTIALSSMEFKLLEYFLLNPHRVLTRELILERIGSHSEYYDRSLDVQMSRLRAKLRDSGRNPTLIRTMRGDGYMLAVSVTKDAAS